MEYKLMIVDGEEQVRRGLAEGMPWDQWGYQVSALCANGREALDRMDTVQPDVVLSNICMPVMDGIDLMQWVHQNRPWIKIVILSCYKDFEHLNLAIKNQVTDYLLKPVDPKAFREVFENLHRKIEGERRSEEDIRHSVEFHFEQWLRNLTKGTASAQDSRRFAAIAEQRGIHLENCYLADLHLDGRESEDAQTARKVTETVIRKLSRLQLPIDGYFLLADEGKMAGIFSAPGNQLEPETVASAVRLIQNEVHRELGGSLSVGLSRHVTSMEGLAEAWQNAIFCTWQSLLRGNETLMFYEEIDLTGEEQIRYFSAETIEGYLLDGDYEAMEAEVSRVFDSMAAGPMLEYRTVDRLVLSLLFTIDLWAVRYDVYMDRIFKSLGSTYEDIHRCDTLKNKKDFLCAVLFAVQLQMKKQRTRSKKGASLAYQVRELIEREFDNSEMSLDYIADKLSKHPSYISKIVKKELHCSFNEYLNKLRIEKAEQLLLMPENKVYEIARACGYVDTSHFNRVFRKYKGVSPSEYREEGTRA